MIVLISLVRFFFSVECSAVGQTVGNMSKSAEVMKLVNNLMEGSTNGCNYAGVHQRDD